jgi:hypothetical protein
VLLEDVDWWRSAIAFAIVHTQAGATLEQLTTTEIGAGPAGATWTLVRFGVMSKSNPSLASEVVDSPLDERVKRRHPKLSAR